ncbi:MAG: NfeD family protein [Chloroflexota bacterium]
MFGPDWLANLFLFVFLFGLIFTIASLVLGFVGGGADGGHAGHVGGHDIHIDLPGSHDIHIDLGGHGGEHGGEHGSQHAGTGGPGVLNIPTIMAFLTWFGGVGFILRQSLGWNGYIVAPLAIISGLTGGTIMFLLLARVLWPMMSKPLSQAEFSLPGTTARVVSSIRAGGVGEIVYSKRGTRFTAGAKSEDSDAIPKGAEVIIMRYERGLAYVLDVADLRAKISDGELELDALEPPDEPDLLQSPSVETLDEGSVRSDRQTSRR